MDEKALEHGWTGIHISGFSIVFYLRWWPGAHDVMWLYKGKGKLISREVWWRGFRVSLLQLLQQIMKIFWLDGMEKQSLSWLMPPPFSHLLQIQMIACTRVLQAKKGFNRSSISFHLWNKSANEAEGSYFLAVRKPETDWSLGVGSKTFQGEFRSSCSLQVMMIEKLSTNNRRVTK